LLVFLLNHSTDIIYSLALILPFILVLALVILYFWRTIRRDQRQETPTTSIGT
jgi:hypothetical protein